MAARRAGHGVPTTNANGPVARSSCLGLVWGAEWWLGGRRRPGARHTKADWVLEVAGLLEGRCADCRRDILVCYNLDTHTKGTFYEMFEPARAWELASRI